MLDYRSVVILLMEEIRLTSSYMVNIPLFAGFYAGFLPSTAVIVIVYSTSRIYKPLKWWYTLGISHANILCPVPLCSPPKTQIPASNQNTDPYNGLYTTTPHITRV